MPYDVPKLFAVVNAGASAQSAEITAPPRLSRTIQEYFLFLVDVTAISGAGATLDLTVEGSWDGVAWFKLVRWSALTAVISGFFKVLPGTNDTAEWFTNTALTAGTHRNFSPTRLRLNYTITGTTPLITFDVYGRWEP